MVTITLNGKQVNLATTLRVTYALKDIVGAKSLQEAMGFVQKLDLDKQLEFLYAAYKAGDGKNSVEYNKESFIDAVMDSLGVFAITNTVNAIAEGMLYAGLSPEVFC